MSENIALTEAVYYILLSQYEPMHGYDHANVEQLKGRVSWQGYTLRFHQYLLEKGGLGSSRRKQQKKRVSDNTTGKDAVEHE